MLPLWQICSSDSDFNRVACWWHVTPDDIIKHSFLSHSGIMMWTLRIEYCCGLGTRPRSSPNHELTLCMAMFRHKYGSSVIKHCSCAEFAFTLSLFHIYQEYYLYGEKYTWIWLHQCCMHAAKPATKHTKKEHIIQDLHKSLPWSLRAASVILAGYSAPFPPASQHKHHLAYHCFASQWPQRACNDS